MDGSTRSWRGILLYFLNTLRVVNTASNVGVVELPFEFWDKVDKIIKLEIEAT